MSEYPAGTLFATIIEMNGLRWRSSWFATRREAVAYADRSPGVVAVEEIGVGIVWERT